ncbi:MAG: hypothetical protein AB7O66_03820 [Limisphaerales bacterium]
MNLDEAQMSRVRAWIDQGLKVAEVQSRLAEEFGVRLTYMEARFLLDDLQLKPKDPVAPPAPAPTQAAGANPASMRPAGAPGAGPGGPGLAGPSGGPLGGGPLPLPGPGPVGALGKVSVSTDAIARPGALVSGKVTFSDGQAADWQMDQYGRLGVAPKTPGYKPSQADVAGFQAELEAALARLGY